MPYNSEFLVDLCSSMRLSHVRFPHCTDSDLEGKGVFSEGPKWCGSEGRSRLPSCSLTHPSPAPVRCWHLCGAAPAWPGSSAAAAVVSRPPPPPPLLAFWLGSGLGALKTLLARRFTLILIFCYSVSLFCVSLCHFSHIRLVLNNFTIFPSGSLCVDHLLHLSS